MRMTPNTEVVDHVSSIEQLAHQLNLGEPILDQVVIYKILSTLPHCFPHLLLGWDCVPKTEQTVEAFMLCLLKEESRNKIQEGMNEDGKKAIFTSWGQGQALNLRRLSTKERKRQFAKIAELKKKTKCQKYGKRGHWEHKCLDDDKNRSFEKKQKQRHKEIRGKHYHHWRVRIG